MAIEKKHVFQTYKRFPLIIEKASGCYLYSTDGDEYLDFLGGIAVNSLGHTHKKIRDAVVDQIDRYMHVSNYFYQEPQVRLAEKLCEITGFDRVFFTNSGAESVEGIIKLVRRWGHAMGKTKIISFTGGFHGRTYGALSLMDKPHYKDKMGPFLPNMQVLRYNNTGDLREYVDANTAAVVLEFIQGEGGITEADPEFIELLEELKLKYGFLVAADEIQSGCGRTGKFFGFDHYGCNPDLVAMAKGIGGGLPLGAILGRESLANVFEKGMHGTTYGGNPVACAAGLAVMNELQSGYIEHAAEMGEYLERALMDIRKEFPDKIAEVRGKGLMKGLALNFDAAPLVEALFAEKIITNAASGTVLRLVPPLVIEKEHIDRLAETISKLLPDMAAE